MFASGLFKITEATSYIELNSVGQIALYDYTLERLAAIFEAKMKATIDNQEPQKSHIFKRCFNPSMAPF